MPSGKLEATSVGVTDVNVNCFRIPDARNVIDRPKIPMLPVNFSSQFLPALWE